MIKNIIFDVDGTLVDSNDFHAQAWQKTFEKFGKTIDLKLIRDQIGKGGDTLLPVFWSEDELKNLKGKLEETRGEIFKNDYLKRIQPFSDARTLIAKLVADGRKVALASSAKKEELEHFKELLGIEDFLEGETTSDDAEASKPEPDIFLAAMKELGNPAPEETVVIGDTPYDAIAARKAGLQTIGVLSGGFDEKWLRDEGCVEIYKNVSDLLAKFDDSILSTKEKVKPKTFSDVVGSLLMLL